MPLTKTGNFMLTEDAQGYANGHASMAAAFIKLAVAATDEDKRQRAYRLASQESEQAEEYRRIAAGEYGPKRAEVAV